ncbi:MAG: hypothetical protein JXB18_01485, partial [Sedimentisphaerales bacterium]|nr:hypothetical protein [Sedimentisphaerales bacterium]
MPAENRFLPESNQEKKIDEKAVEILKDLSTTVNSWYSVEVPQFHNPIKWWLGDVSREYEKQEQARIAAFPFDAEKVQSGWYLKEINLPEIIGPKPNVIVSFEGIAMVSRVYCNGRYVGSHLGMFGQFDCDLSPVLNWGQANTILVYVQRGVQAPADAGQVVSVAVTVPVTRDMLTSLNCGMFGGFGRGPRARFMGIWQPVTLKVSEPGPRIRDVFFVPLLDGHRLEIDIENPGTAPREGQLLYSLVHSQNQQVLCEDKTQRLSIAPGAHQAIQLDKTGLTPEWWTPDTPVLYRLEVKWLSDKGQLLDRWEEQVGYRIVQVKGKRIYLNGKPYWCRGADMPPYGYKPNDAAVARGFLEKMKEGNTVITRSHGNPFNRLWFGLCDEIGIGVSCEGVRPWALMSKTPPPSPAILEHWKQEQLESVRQYRNHPSILFYCISNEGLQGDHENPEKLAIFKDIIEAVRKLDPTRPIFQTSGDPDHQGIADIEDVHAYWGWYEASSFVNQYNVPRRGLVLSGDRAFINQECAVPYQNTDTGGVHPAYIKRYSAHPWVGELGVHGDPKYFSQHVAMEGKLKAEKLRYQRKDVPTAGVMLFSNVTWIQHVLSRTPAEWKPFPVWHGVKQAFEPVLAAWENTQYVFYAGQEVRSHLYVVNDDIHFRDISDLRLKVETLNRDGQAVSSVEKPLGQVDYYGVKKYPLDIFMPDSASLKKLREPFTIHFSLYSGSERLSENTYAVEIVSDAWLASTSQIVLVDGCSDDLKSQLRNCGFTVSSWNERSEKADTVIIGPVSTSTMESILPALKPGGRILLLEHRQKTSAFDPSFFPVTDWQAPRNCQLVKGGFKEGALWASDRKDRLGSMPASLKGKDYILVSMEDKYSDAASPLFKLTLEYAADVYVGYNERAKVIPAWLQSYAQTGDFIEIPGNCRLKLFKKKYEAGEVILNGNNPAKNPPAMYTVIIDSP